MKTHFLYNEKTALKSEVKTQCPIKYACGMPSGSHGGPVVQTPSGGNFPISTQRFPHTALRPSPQSYDAMGWLEYRPIMENAII